MEVLVIHKLYIGFQAGGNKSTIFFMRNGNEITMKISCYLLKVEVVLNATATDLLLSFGWYWRLV